MVDPPRGADDGAAGAPPSDAGRMRALLESMDVGPSDADPGVVTHLLDFMYRYVTDMLLDAEAYSEHAGKAPGTVEMDDVMLAIQARTAYGFVQPPSLDAIAGMAHRINARPMPGFPMHKTGVLLPDDGACLTQQNYQYEPVQAEQQQQQMLQQQQQQLQSPTQEQQQGQPPQQQQRQPTPMEH